MIIRLLIEREREEAAHGGSAIPWRPAGPGEQAHP